jgi:CDP-diacylglycerol--glycerol-3-phosphate 3-phosphatidyltransferase
LTPNALTVIGLLGMGGAASFAAYGKFWQAGIVMLAAAVFDLLDGAVARATDRASDWGAVFDAVSDRLADFALLFGLLIWYSATERFDRTAIVLIAVSLFGSLMVSYTRSKAGEFGVSIRTGLGTRLERVLIMAIGLLSAQIIPILWLLAVLTNLTALQRWFITWRAMHSLEQEPPRISEADDEPEEPDGPSDSPFGGQVGD